MGTLGWFKAITKGKPKSICRVNLKTPPTKFGWWKDTVRTPGSHVPLDPEIRQVSRGMVGFPPPCDGSMSCLFDRLTYFAFGGYR